MSCNRCSMNNCFSLLYPFCRIWFHVFPYYLKTNRLFSGEETWIRRNPFHLNAVLNHRDASVCNTWVDRSMPCCLDYFHQFQWLWSEEFTGNLSLDYWKYSKLHRLVIRLLICSFLYPCSCLELSGRGASSWNEDPALFECSWNSTDSHCIIFFTWKNDYRYNQQPFQPRDQMAPVSVFLLLLLFDQRSKL